MGSGADEVARNVAAVELGWERFSREPITLERVTSGDLDGVLEIFDPAVVISLTGFGWPGGDEYRGHHGLSQFWSEWFEAFESVDAEVVALEAAEDKVVTVTVMKGSGRAGGAPAAMEYTTVFTMRDGKAVRLDLFSDQEEARAAARLDPAAGRVEAN